MQDNWRLTSHLTLNLGLRYELTTPRGDSDHNNNVNFDKITGMPEIGKNYNTYTGIDNFQPRIGLAWQPAFLPNTVFRAAYGISTYMEGNGVNNLAVVNPPYVVNREANNTGLSLPPFTLDQGYTAFPSAPCTAAGLLAFSPECLSSTTVHATNPNIQPAVDQQWNATIQHQFGNSTTVSAAYVGNKIDHMTDIYLLNQEQLVNGVISPSPFAAPLIAAGANVRYNDSSAIQRFNALELTLVERPSTGSRLKQTIPGPSASRTRSAISASTATKKASAQVRPAADISSSRIFTTRRPTTAAASATLPARSTATCFTICRSATVATSGSDVSGWVNQIIGGWQVATAFNIHSGFAINPSAPDQSTTGGGVGAATGQLRVRCCAAWQRSFRRPRQEISDFNS